MEQLVKVKSSSASLHLRECGAVNGLAFPGADRAPETAPSKAPPPFFWVIGFVVLPMAYLAD
jgi:hypothetical protein